MSTWPFSWSAMTALVLAIFLIVTCSPCRANRPSSRATYRPARSADGMAATVMSGFSPARAAAAVASPGDVAQPAARAVTAAASRAAPDFQAFIQAPRACGTILAHPRTPRGVRDNAARIVGQLVCAYSHETIAGSERE